jgi:AraC-like DNA-binding protein
MKNSALRENLSLDAGDSLIFFTAGLQPGSRAPRCIKEYELTLLPAALQAKLTIGDMTELLSGPQLVLLAPGVPFSWSGVQEPTEPEVRTGVSVTPQLEVRTGVSATPQLEVRTGVSATAQSEARAGVSPTALVLRWPGDLLGDKLLGKNLLHPIGNLLQNALRGVVFAPEVIVSAEPLLAALRKKRGFESVLGLLSLLNELSMATGSRPVADKVYTSAGTSAGDNRINSAVAYMRANYSQPITLDDVARKARMTKGAFCRSILKRTGKTYAESLSEIRIDHICKRLLSSSDTVSEIAYQAGYNNVPHFHRCFKRLKGCTPKEFRQVGQGRHQ